MLSSESTAGIGLAGGREEDERFMTRARGKLARRQMRGILYERTGIKEEGAQAAMEQARALIAQRLS